MTIEKNTIYPGILGQLGGHPEDRVVGGAPLSAGDMTLPPLSEEAVRKLAAQKAREADFVLRCLPPVTLETPLRRSTIASGVPCKRKGRHRTPSALLSVGCTVGIAVSFMLGLSGAKMAKPVDRSNAANIIRRKVAIVPVASGSKNTLSQILCSPVDVECKPVNQGGRLHHYENEYSYDGKRLPEGVGMEVSLSTGETAIFLPLGSSGNNGNHIEITLPGGGVYNVSPGTPKVDRKSGPRSSSGYMPVVIQP